MVLLTVTPQILECLLQSQTQDGTTSDVPAVGSPIAHERVVELAKAKARREQKNGASHGHDQKEQSLDNLLRGTSLYVPPPPPKAAKTPEYIALMARLRAEQEEREYRIMLDNPSKISGQDLLLANFDGRMKLENEKEMMREINSQISVIFNVVFSIFACAGGVWYVARHWPVGYRLFLSLFAGLLVGVAEVVVYNGFLRKVEESRKEERKVKEVKEVVRTWTTDDHDTLTIESETEKGEKEAVESSESLLDENEKKKMDSENDTVRRRKKTKK